MSDAPSIYNNDPMAVKVHGWGAGRILRLEYMEEIVHNIKKNYFSQCEQMP